MKLCYVLLEYPVLSQTFVRDEMTALSEAGAGVLSVSLRGGPGADIALGERRSRSWWTWSRAVRLAARHPVRAGRALRSGPLALGVRLKLLAVAHDALRQGVTGVHAHFAYPNADAAELLGELLGTGHSLTVHAHDIFVERQHLGRRLEAARVVITVCEYNARHLAASFPSVITRLHIVPCSTSIEEPPRRTAPEATRLLAVGRLVPKKGIDVVIRAVAAMTHPASLTIVGDGPERSRLEELARQLGVTGRVEFRGPLSHQATKEAMAAAGVFTLAFRVAPDGDRDSMPVVVKEAMAAGLPVVTTRVVGVPEMVDDGVTGLLVEPDEPAALAAALDRLVSNPALASAMGARGRAVVADRFDLRKQAKALLEILG